jgi:hypothetical protein
MVEYFGLTEEEARTYLRAIEEGTLTGDHRSLVSRGMLILSADEKVYLPVHPRLALSNLFRSQSDRLSPEMKAKRRLVDKLTLELVLVYEKRRGAR